MRSAMPPGAAPGGAMIALLWVVVIGLPFAVIVGAMCWPERIPPKESVNEIPTRVEADDRRRSGCHGPG
ncbi:hypothetical protein NFA_38750 [Nocardia farcinica IFM 10152]|uniref:Uncharacterized protein n=2 Tax=Nocardia farcinica TaxID=37329 RepID=Q5YSW8_NOCFA|nr:hypothetical protein NFA_38750 [Nocardia farcinica IFM 10152]